MQDIKEFTLDQTSGLFELSFSHFRTPLNHSTHSKVNRWYASAEMNSFLSTLSLIDKRKFEYYLTGLNSRQRNYHSLSLSDYSLSFRTKYHPTRKEHIISDVFATNDSAIKRASLKHLNMDAGLRDIDLGKSELSGIADQRFSLALRKIMGKGLTNKLKVAAVKGHSIAPSVVRRYDDYLKIILTTKEGRKFANIVDTGKFVIALFSDPWSNSSYGNEIVQINVHPKQSQRYSEAFGKNTYVQLGGIRSLAHELTHAFYRDSGSKQLIVREETKAMRTTNQIMREIYGLDAGERRSYRSTSKVPSGSIILK